jgi:carbonic anhydrase/acetyltransferase-like protein (isoleucine patch superfamily)
MRKVGECFIAANATVLGDIVLSPEVNIWYGCVLRGDLARITLGPRVNLQDGCIVHTDFDAPMDIEADVAVGHRVTLHGRRVGRGSLIGMGAILLSGSEIGEQSLVAAGTLIPERKVFPPRSVIMGSPGKVVRQVTEADLALAARIATHYLALAGRHAAGEFVFPLSVEGRS